MGMLIKPRMFPILIGSYPALDTAPALSVSEHNLGEEKILIDF